MNLTPLRLAGCVIRNETGALLLLHRNKNGLQQWELPGGKLEPGEKPQQAAIREIQEELGVSAAIKEHLGEAAFIEKERECLYAWYEATIEGAPSICEPQTFDSLQYLGVAELRARSDISANLKNLLESGVL